MPKARRRILHVVGCVLFLFFVFGEGIASGKPVERLQTNQRRLVKRSTERRSNKMADSPIRMSSVLSFDFVS